MNYYELKMVSKQDKKLWKIIGWIVLIIAVIIIAFVYILSHLLLLTPNRVTVQEGQYFSYINHSYTLIGNCTLTTLNCTIDTCDQSYSYYDNKGNLINCHGYNDENCSFKCYPNNYLKQLRERYPGVYPETVSENIK